MKKQYLKLILVALMVVMGASFCFSVDSYAEGEENAESSQEGSSSEEEITGASISLSPVSKIIQIEPSMNYDSYFEVGNNGNTPIKIEVYAAPYSYVHSDEDDSYHLGFSNETKFTQMSRWITIKNSMDTYEEKPTFTIPAHEKIKVYYRISTPDSIPDGGQYAVIFSHTLSDSKNANGIRTEASPGLVVYGRSANGESITDAEITEIKFEQSFEDNGTVKNHFLGMAKVKNNGNIDFNAAGKMTVEGLFGGVRYETPANAGRISVIPESELVLTDEWEDTPGFGIFRVTWTVIAGEKTETIERMVFLIPPFLIIFVILLLTIITIWIILMVRKRRARRSRLAI